VASNGHNLQTLQDRLHTEPSSKAVNGRHNEIFGIVHDATAASIARPEPRVLITVDDRVVLIPCLWKGPQTLMPMNQSRT
jgi:hypothetical protein